MQLRFLVVGTGAWLSSASNRLAREALLTILRTCFLAARTRLPLRGLPITRSCQRGRSKNAVLFPSKNLITLAAAVPPVVINSGIRRGACIFRISKLARHHSLRSATLASARSSVFAVQRKRAPERQPVLCYEISLSETVLKPGSNRERDFHGQARIFLSLKCLDAASIRAPVSTVIPPLRDGMPTAGRCSLSHS
jgi:hypothetical protein